MNQGFSILEMVIVMGIMSMIVAAFQPKIAESKLLNQKIEARRALRAIASAQFTYRNQPETHNEYGYLGDIGYFFDHENSGFEKPFVNIEVTEVEGNFIFSGYCIHFEHKSGDFIYKMTENGEIEEIKPFRQEDKCNP